MKKSSQRHPFIFRAKTISPKFYVTIHFAKLSNVVNPSICCMQTKGREKKTVWPKFNCWVISRQPYAYKSSKRLKLAITCKLSFDSPCTNDNLHFRSQLRVFSLSLSLVNIFVRSCLNSFFHVCTHTNSLHVSSINIWFCV